MLYTTLEAVKKALGVSLEDHSQDTQLHQLMAQASRAIDLWAKREFGRRRYREVIEPARQQCAVRNTLEVVGQGYRELRKHLPALEEPQYIAGIKPRFNKWMEDVENVLPEDPTLCMLWSREAISVVGEHLCCTPRVSWIIECTPPGEPLWIRGIEAYFRQEVVLCFTTATQRMDVWVGWDGEQERSKLRQKVQKLLVPYSLKRLYLPPPGMDEKAEQQWIKSNIALLCLYLVQEGLVSLNTDPPLWEFLLSYLQTFRGVETLEAPNVLGDLIARYRIPEDGRAWCKYVADTIKHLVKNPERSTYSYVIPDPTSPTGLQYMIPAAADRVEMSHRRLYQLVEAGEVRTETVSVDGKQYQIVPLDEIDQLQTRRTQKRGRQVLIARWADARGISTKSARTWVTRQERQGLSREAICQKIRDTLQQHQQGSDT